MIRIKVLNNNNYVKQIVIEGHALYDEYGKDIVCAAVSATYLCTVNAILTINKDSIKVTSSDDVQMIDVLIEDEIIEKLLNNMVRCLKSLEQKYPNNIKIK